MRKVLSVFGLLLLLGLSACGGTESTETNAEDEGRKNEIKGTVDPEYFDKMYSPEAYKRYEVEFTGQVFVKPERNEDAVYLQVFAKPEKSEHNVLVSLKNTKN